MPIANEECCFLTALPICTACHPLDYPDPSSQPPTSSRPLWDPERFDSIKGFVDGDGEMGWQCDVTFHFRYIVAKSIESSWLSSSGLWSGLCLLYCIICILRLSNCSGIFNVPHVTSIYLVKSSAFDAISFQHKEFDPDMALCESLRNAVRFLSTILFNFFVN